MGMCGRTWHSHNLLPTSRLRCLLAGITGNRLKLSMPPITIRFHRISLWFVSICQRWFGPWRGRLLGNLPLLLQAMPSSSLWRLSHKRQCWTLMFLLHRMNCFTIPLPQWWNSWVIWSILQSKSSSEITVKFILLKPYTLILRYIVLCETDKIFEISLMVKSWSIWRILRSPTFIPHGSFQFVRTIFRTLQLERHHIRTILYTQFFHLM